jgi:hypothetical protein
MPGRPILSKANYIDGRDENKDESPNLQMPDSTLPVCTGLEHPTAA